jgi:hypothetical protein
MMHIKVDDEHHERMPGMDNFDPEMYVEYILAQVQLPRDDEPMLFRRAKDGNDKPKGKHNQDPFFIPGSNDPLESPKGRVLEISMEVVHDLIVR